MIIDIIKTTFQLFWYVLKYPLYVLGPSIAVLILIVIANYIKLRFIDKVPVKYGEHYKVKEDNIFKKIFIQFPKQYAKDIINRNPEEMKYHGCIVYCGRQGSGKTSSLVRDTMKIQKEYPKCKVISNLGYTKANAELKHWKQLTDYKNGPQGIVVQIDEMQNWFNSKQSKNFPPEMLQVVTQNRKNRRVIFGTAQNFYMLAKDIRSQCTEIRQCITLCGCLTIVIRKRPIINNEGEVEKTKLLGIYCWVHNEETRNAYDTYKVINALSKSGFKEESEQYRLNNNLKIEVEQQNERKILKRKSS